MPLSMPAHILEGRLGGQLFRGFRTLKHVTSCWITRSHLFCLGYEHGNRREKTRPVSCPWVFDIQSHTLLPVSFFSSFCHKSVSRFHDVFNIINFLISNLSFFSSKNIWKFLITKCICIYYIRVVSIIFIGKYINTCFQWVYPKLITLYYYF